MMALGAYRFAVTTGGYERLQRSTSWRWPTQERIGSAPAHQFMGPGTDKLTISGVIFPHFRGGLRQVDAMRAQAGRGQPLNMVDGTGVNWDRWVVMSIEEGKEAFMSDGAARKIDFSVELEKYA